MGLSLQFDVVNATDWPLTLAGAFVVIADHPYRTGEERKHLVPPNGRFPIIFSIKVTQEQLSKWANDKLTLFLYGWILFDDTLEKRQGQPFSGAVVCSKKDRAIFIPPYGSGLYIDTRKKKGE